MSIDIPGEYQAFIEAAVSSGQFADETAVVGQALRMLAEHCRSQAALRAAVEHGITSGEGIPEDEAFAMLEAFARQVDTTVP